MQAVTSNIAPLSVAPNGRSFLDKQGKPFFWLGDTLWHLYRSFSLADVREILTDRKRKGFSVLQIMFFGYENDPQPNINGHLPWLDNDPSKPNERYWDHVDQAMQIACEFDYIQIPGIYHKTQAKYYSLESAGKLAQWIARRYRDVPQLIWSMYPEAKQQYVPICRAMADNLRHGDGGAHLITVHPDPSPQSSRFLHSEPWLAFNSVQTWNEIEQVYPMTAADYGLTPIKPVVMAEGGYETANNVRHILPADIRRQAYWTYLAGGHHVYGHDGNWRSPATWRDWLDAPGTNYLAVYRQIISSLPNWWDIVPDQSIIAKGVGSSVELNAAGHSRDADWALVYFAIPTTAKVRMDRVKTHEPIKATWIDPRNGAKTPAGQFAYTDTKEFTVPAGWEDALLLLD